jgi:hypothetical protein
MLKRDVRRVVEMKVGWRVRVLGLGLGFLLVAGAAQARAQASALPSAAPGGDDGTVLEANKGRKLLGQMVQALGGDLWLNRQNWVYQGKAATFYKGQPHEGAPGFIEYYQAKPFAERVQVISQYGVFIATDHKDIVDLWTPDGGYEITYKGKNPLPEKDVAEFERRHAHSLEVVVNDWLKQPGTIVTYEGAGTVERRLSEQVSILTASNDAVVLNLDAVTHLPLSISFEWRDPLYKDINKDTQEFDDYHQVQGIQTAYSITNFHNGEMFSQRFLSKVNYNETLPPEFFDPNHPLKKAK